VTAIAHGANGDAVRVNGFVDQPATLQAVNVIARGDRYDVAAESYSSPAKAFLRHSNFRGGSHVHVTPNASIGATNQQTTDPLFVSPFDFHEKKGSVTIDFGTAKGLTGKRDLDGLPRTIGSHPDVGAYEYLPPFLGVSIGKKATVGADGRAAVRLGCRAKTVGRCKGKLRLARSSDNKTLGTTKFSLRRGKSRVVKVPLTKGAQTALASGKTLNATATAAAHDGVGQSATTKRALQLKR
jgi:hypothetical protein